jgi:hypothetical protein
MVLVSLALAGCVAPMPVVRLLPESPNVTWVSGLAVVTQEQSGIRIALAFDRHDGDSLAFRLEVMNNTTGQFEISARDVVFVTCKGPTSYSDCSARQGAIDPEATLQSLDEAHSLQIADATNSEILGTSLMLLSVTADVAGAASGHPRSGATSASTLSALNSSEAVHQSTIGQIESERAKWAATALRRTTLLPAHSLAGFVFVPTNFQARFVWVQVQIGTRKFPFVFEQTSTIPAPASATEPSRSWG